MDLNEEYGDKGIDPADMIVLIVDDMDAMCKSIRGLLKVLNYGKQFHFAHDGVEAWNLLQKERVDMAIVDWNMPNMTGVELLSHIREDRGLRDLPIVMVTAEANREIVAEAAESDIDAYILKPLTAKALADKVSSVLEKANNPPPMIFHLKRARDYEEDGDVDAAIEEVKKAMEADPQSSRPSRELGYLYFKKNDMESAEEWLLKAAKMNELDVFACHYLGEIYLQRNDVDRAFKYLEKAMNISPRHVSRGLEFGKILIQKDMTRKALKVFEKTIQLSASPLEMQEEVADICMENKEYDYAAKLLGSVLQVTPNRFDLMKKIGVANSAMGNHREALSFFIEAGKKDKDNVDLKLDTAKSYINIGQILRAEQLLKSVISIEPENEEAKELLRKTA